MPYYCTVPRCTSMAGKAKNVSFHQFPRDEELARLWNKVLKRGKPYTKYSKVCSLHFRPEDYTITSVGKNKGQWRTLRKDAVPSQNLPTESPVATTHYRTRNTGCWAPSNAPTPLVDPRVQHSMAQAIYMQTMLALAASNGTHTTQGELKSLPTDLTASQQSNPPIPDLEQILQNGQKDSIHTLEIQKLGNKATSYKCLECSKCFKDPDVFVLHRRTHTKNSQEKPPESGKENIPNSEVSRQETLRANPILANLLKSGINSPQTNDIPDLINNFNGVFDTNNILSIENQIMTALAANMESYIRNLTSMLSEANNKDGDKSSDGKTDNGEPSSGYDEEINSESSENVDGNDENDQNGDDECQNSESENVNTDKVHKNNDNEQKSIKKQCQNVEKQCQYVEKQFQIEVEGSKMDEDEPGCDKQDLNDSKDSLVLVIDENA